MAAKLSASIMVATAAVATLLASTPHIASAAPTPQVDVALAITSDGTEPFNGSDDPGFDSDANNGVVRALDYVGIEVDYQFNNVDDGDTRFVTVSADRGGFDSVPSACGPHTTLSTDTTTLECEIVPTRTAGTVGTISHQILVGAAQHGDTLTVSATSTAGANVSTTETATLTISAAPFWDATTDDVQVYPTDFSNGRPGWVVVAPVMVEADLAATGDGRGTEGLAGPVTFNVQPTMVDALGVDYPVELYDEQGTQFAALDVGACGANETTLLGTPKRNAATTESLGTLNSTSESGDWTCSQATPGGPISVVVDGADLSPNRFPSGTIATGHYTPRKIMLSGYVTVMIYKDGQIEDSLPGGGVLPVDFEITDFDPIGLSGGSNFGAADETTTNNFSAGNVSTYPPDAWGAMFVNTTHFLDPNGDHPGYPDAPDDAIFFDERPSFLNPGEPPFYPTQSQSIHTGDGIVYPGAIWEYEQEFAGAVTAVSPGVMCFGFDAATSTVVNAPPANVWLIESSPGDLFGTNIGDPITLPATNSPLRVINEYFLSQWGTGPNGTTGTADEPIIQYGQAVTPIDGSPITCDDDDALTWHNDPSPFDDGTGAYPDLTTVRVFWPGGVPYGELARVTVTLQADPGLAPGTYVSAQSAWAAYDGSWTGSGTWHNSSYDKTVHDNPIFGDRMVIGERTMLVAKDIVSTPNGPLRAGDEVDFRLTGRLDGTPADVTLTDFVPVGMSITASTPEPTNLYPGVGPAGADVYEWVFPATSGTVTVDYTARATSRAVAGSTLLNILQGSATVAGADVLDQDDETLRSFQRVIVATQSSGLDVWNITPDDVEFVDDQLVFDLNAANVSTEPLSNLDVIGVLPWNGDDRNSEFTGTYALLAPTTTSAPASGVILSATSEAPDTVDTDPATNTNTWCEADDFGTAGCPTAWAEVTALRATSSELLAGERLTINIVLDPDSNAAGDYYGNDWMGRSDASPFLARSDVAVIDVVGNSLSVDLVCGAAGSTRPAVPFSVSGPGETQSGTTNSSTLSNLAPGAWTVTVDVSPLVIGVTEQSESVAMRPGVDERLLIELADCGTATQRDSATATPATSTGSTSASASATSTASPSASTSASVSASASAATSATSTSTTTTAPAATTITSATASNTASNTATATATDTNTATATNTNTATTTNATTATATNLSSTTTPAQARLPEAGSSSRAPYLLPLGLFLILTGSGLLTYRRHRRI